MSLLPFSGSWCCVAKGPLLCEGWVDGYVEGYPGLILLSFSLSLAALLCCRMEVNSLVLEVETGLPVPAAASLCQCLVPGQAEP